MYFNHKLDYFRDAVLFIFGCDLVLKLLAHRRKFC